MTATYDPSVPTDRDWVRLNIPDTSVSAAVPALLQDQELDALLANEPNKHFAAARALSILYGRWAALGEGVLEKEVDALRIKRGIDSTAAQAIQARIDELRRRGAWLSTPKSRIFKTL